MKNEFLQVEKKGQWALALSGGGARGIVHIGVLSVLDEYGLTPSRIAGTSVGAIVGALYAAGVAPAKMLELVGDKGFLDMFRVRPTRSKLFEMKFPKNVLNDFLPERFEDLRIPLVVCVTSLTSQRAIYLDTGDVKTAVLASACVPVLFAPVIVNGETCVDGGVLDNLPAEPLADAGFGTNILGVEVNRGTFIHDNTTMRSIARDVFHLIVANNSHKGELHCRETIIPDLSGFDIFDFTKAQELYDIGREVTKKWMHHSQMVSPDEVPSHPKPEK